MNNAKLKFFKMSLNLQKEFTRNSREKKTRHMDQYQVVAQKLGSLRQLKIEMEQINASKKSQKAKVDEIQKLAVQFMLSTNRRFIAAELDGPNSGPYYVLGKNLQEGHFTKETEMDYWKQFITHMKEHVEDFTPAKCAESRRAFLQSYDKRSIVLNELTQLRERDGVDRLKRWLITGEDD
jgi:hypothetical protein